MTSKGRRKRSIKTGWQNKGRCKGGQESRSSGKSFHCVTDEFVKGSEAEWDIVSID